MESLVYVRATEVEISRSEYENKLIYRKLSLKTDTNLSCQIHIQNK